MLALRPIPGLAAARSITSACITVRVVRFVAENSVALTRQALADSRVDRSHVVGWVDLTSPNLVDLLDDLIAGPGGDRLVALRCNLYDISDPCATRGLACLEQAKLALYADRDDVATQAAEMFPRLQIMRPDTRV